MPISAIFQVQRRVAVKVVLPSYHDNFLDEVKAHNGIAQVRQGDTSGLLIHTKMESPCVLETDDGKPPLPRKHDSRQTLISLSPRRSQVGLALARQ